MKSIEMSMLKLQVHQRKGAGEEDVKNPADEENQHLQVESKLQKG